MPDQDVRPRDACAFQQRTEVRREGIAVLLSRLIAPAVAGAVVGADRGRCGDRRRDGRPGGRRCSETRLEDDRRATGAGAFDVEPMPADIDEAATWRGRNGWFDGADGGEAAT